MCRCPHLCLRDGCFTLPIANYTSRRRCPFNRKLHSFPSPWDSGAAAWDLSSVRLLRLLQMRQMIPFTPGSCSPAFEFSLLSCRCIFRPGKKNVLQRCTGAVPLLQNLQNPTGIIVTERLAYAIEFAPIAAQPQGEWQAKGVELPSKLGKRSLDFHYWGLGEAPAGTYHLTLAYRGRLVSELPFRVCAGLEIDAARNRTTCRIPRCATAVTVFRSSAPVSEVCLWMMMKTMYP